MNVPGSATDTPAWLGLGANLGDRLTTLDRAARLLAETPGVVVEASSRVWETAPVGGPPQPDYLNAVVRIRTSLSPRELLDRCQEIERQLGRDRQVEVRWGPRPIDIDILLFAGLIVDEPPDLVVPHPRMTERAFVLLPLLEIEPDLTLPDGRRLLDLPLGPDAAGGAHPAFPPLAILAP